MRKNSLFLWILGLSVLLSACSKDEEKTTMDYLTEHSWRLTSWKVAGNEYIEACQKDDLMSFTSSGNFKYDPGTNRCSSDQQIETGTYTLQEMTITLAVDSEVLVLPITTINEETLVFSVSEDGETIVMILVKP